MSDALRDAGSIAAALAAIIGCFVLVSKLPPLRWLWRHLVADPVAQWFRAEMREEIDRRNGGSTLMDMVVALDGRVGGLEQKLDDHTAQDAINFKALEEGIAAIPPQGAP